MGPIDFKFFSECTHSHFGSNIINSTLKSYRSTVLQMPFTQLFSHHFSLCRHEYGSFYIKYLTINRDIIIFAYVFMSLHMVMRYVR